MSELKFEDAIKELETIVDSLESGNLPLDEAITKFQKGIELSKHCSDVLTKAEKEVTILVENENGEMVEEKFKAEE